MNSNPWHNVIVSQIEVVPMHVVRVKVIGVMRMIDSGEADDKIIAVAADYSSVNHIEAMNGLPPYFTVEIRHFFEEYKRLENKTVRVENFKDKKTAEKYY